MQISKSFFLFPALTFSTLVWGQSNLFLESSTEKTQTSSNKSLQTDYLEKKIASEKKRLEDLEKNAQSLEQKINQAKAANDQANEKKYSEELSANASEYSTAKSELQKSMDSYEKEINSLLVEKKYVPEKEQSALQDLKDLKPTIRVDANDLIKPDFDPAQRAQDFRASFSVLKKNNPNGNFYVVVAGRKIPNIIDFHVMPNSSLATLVIKKPSGIEQKVIKTEDLSDIGEVTKKIFITENND